MNNKIPKLYSDQILYADHTVKDQLENIYTKDETMTKSEVKAVCKETINPAPTVKFYNSIKNIPIQNGMQIIYYTQHPGTMKIKMGKAEYVDNIPSANDARWLLWNQNYDIAGSLISTQGFRVYMDTGCIISEAEFEWTTDESIENSAWVVVTIT